MFKSVQVLLPKAVHFSVHFSYEAIISLVDAQLKKKKVYLFSGGSSLIKTLNGAGLNAKQPVDLL